LLDALELETQLGAFASGSADQGEFQLLGGQHLVERSSAILLRFRKSMICFSKS